MFTSPTCVPYVFQANTFASRRDQQGFFTFLHKWIVVVKQRSYLDDIETFVGNVSNVIAVVPFSPVYAIQKVLPRFIGNERHLFALALITPPTFHDVNMVLTSQYLFRLY